MVEEKAQYWPQYTTTLPDYNEVSIDADQHKIDENGWLRFYRGETEVGIIKDWAYFWRSDED